MECVREEVSPLGEEVIELLKAYPMADNWQRGAIGMAGRPMQGGKVLWTDEKNVNQVPTNRDPLVRALLDLLSGQDKDDARVALAEGRLYLNRPYINDRAVLRFQENRLRTKSLLKRQKKEEKKK